MNESLNLALQRVYLKGCSLEVPAGPALFKAQVQGELEIDFAISSNELELGIFESVLTVTLASKNNGKTQFLLEMAQAGIFQHGEATQEATEYARNIAAPTFLLPYLRSNLADALQRATLPVVHLPNFDFAKPMRTGEPKQQAMH